MSPLTALSQAQRAELAHVRPVILVELDLGATRLYWSTRDFVYRYGAERRHYESYLLELSGVGEQADYSGTANPRVTLILADEPYGSHPRLSRLNDAIPFQRKTLSIYECLVVDDAEVFPHLEAGRTLLWKGVVERVYDLDTRERTFKLDCCSRLHSLRNRLGLSRVNTALYPLADKSAVGQWRNLPIGNIDHVPCKLVKTGAADRLFVGMGTGPVTSFAVSGAATIPWQSSGTLQIDAEQFTYTVYDPATRTFHGVQRARNGTVAAQHQQGATVFQVVSEFVYEASCLPVDAITHVTVDAVRQPIGTTCQVYTGRPGDRLPGFGSSAVVRFLVKPQIVKQVNADAAVTQEHDHVTNTGSHNHGLNASAVVVRYGISEQVSGTTTDPEYWRDGASSTATRLLSNNTSGNRAFLACNFNNSANLGAITGIRVVVDLSVSVSASGSGGDSFSITYGSAPIIVWAGNTGGVQLARTTFSWNVPLWAGGWQAGLYFEARSGTPSGYASAYIHSAQVEITYTPALQSSPASGVSAVRSGSTVLSVGSVAEAVIGREVCVGIVGVRDEPESTGGLAAGAVTGVPGSVIRRPDHVIRYILCGLMGLPLTDVGSSFDAAGAWYASKGYAFDFLMHDIDTDGQRLIQELASQCRSIFHEWGGRFELRVLPVYDPGAYDFTVEAEDVISGPVYAYSPIADTANRIMVLYRKDYRTYKEVGASVQGPIRAEAADAGFMDYLEGGWGSRDLDETVRLTAIRTSAPAQDLLDWIVQRRRLTEKTVSFECHWRGTRLRPGMVCALVDPVYGHGAWFVTGCSRDEREGVIAVEGRWLPPWSSGESAAPAFSDTPHVVQTHLLDAQKAAALSAADRIEVLVVLVPAEAAALACADTPGLEQMHLLAAVNCRATAVVDNGYLGVAWDLDAVDDLQPAAYTGVTGWWEDDAADVMPRNTIFGTDNLWQTDGTGDLMPVA